MCVISAVINGLSALNSINRKLAKKVLARYKDNRVILREFGGHTTAILVNNRAKMAKPSVEPIALSEALSG